MSCMNLTSSHVWLQDRPVLEALAQRAGMSVQNLVHDFGHHAVAKHIFEGDCQ